MSDDPELPRCALTSHIIGMIDRVDMGRESTESSSKAQHSTFLFRNAGGASITTRRIGLHRYRRRRDPDVRYPEVVAGATGPMPRVKLGHELDARDGKAGPRGQ